MLKLCLTLCSAASALFLIRLSIAVSVRGNLMYDKLFGGSLWRSLLYAVFIAILGCALTTVIYAAGAALYFGVCV